VLFIKQGVEVATDIYNVVPEKRKEKEENTLVDMATT